jgi:hypothetical protein
MQDKTLGGIPSMRISLQQYNMYKLRWITILSFATLSNDFLFTLIHIGMVHQGITLVQKRREKLG